MTHVERIIREVYKHPGLSASEICRKVFYRFPKQRYGYKRASVLRELHRLFDRNLLNRRKEKSKFNKTFAWKFYPI